MLRPAVQPRPTGATVGINIETELGGDHDLIADRSQRLTDQFFIDERPIDFSRVKKGDTPVDRGMKESDHLLPVGQWIFVVAHPHATQTQRRDFQTTIAKDSFLHRLASQV